MLETVFEKKMQAHLSTHSPESLTSPPRTIEALVESPRSRGLVSTGSTLGLGGSAGEAVSSRGLASAGSTRVNMTDRLLRLSM